MSKDLENLAIVDKKTIKDIVIDLQYLNDSILPKLESLKGIDLVKRLDSFKEYSENIEENSKFIKAHTQVNEVLADNLGEKFVKYEEQLSKISLSPNIKPEDMKAFKDKINLLKDTLETEFNKNLENYDEAIVLITQEIEKSFLKVAAILKDKIEEVIDSFETEDRKKEFRNPYEKQNAVTKLKDVSIQVNILYSMIEKIDENKLNRVLSKINKIEKKDNSLGGFINKISFVILGAVFATYGKDWLIAAFNFLKYITT